MRINDAVGQLLVGSRNQQLPQSDWEFMSEHAGATVDVHTDITVPVQISREQHNTHFEFKGYGTVRGNGESQNLKINRCASLNDALALIGSIASVAGVIIALWPLFGRRRPTTP